MASLAKVRQHTFVVPNPDRIPNPTPKRMVSSVMVGHMLVVPNPNPHPNLSPKPTISSMKVGHTLVVPALVDAPARGFVLLLHRASEGFYSVVVCDASSTCARHPLRRHPTRGHLEAAWGVELGEVRATPNTERAVCVCARARVYAHGVCAHVCVCAHGICAHVCIYTHVE